MCHRLARVLSDAPEEMNELSRSQCRNKSVRFYDGFEESFYLKTMICVFVICVLGGMVP